MAPLNAADASNSKVPPNIATGGPDKPMPDATDGNAAHTGDDTEEWLEMDNLTALDIRSAAHDEYLLEFQSRSGGAPKPLYGRVRTVRKPTHIPMYHFC